MRPIEHEPQLPQGPKAFFERASEGACVGSDTALFFPGGPVAKNSPPMLLCARCDVRKACLDYAIQNREEHGIWGGRSEQERRRIRRERYRGSRSAA